MSHTVWKPGVPARVLVPVALFGLAWISSCGRSQKVISGPIKQSTYASPDEAGAALLAAARSGDRSALTAIFGPDSEQILFTNDAGETKSRLREFVSAYNQMHRWRKIRAGGQALYVGADNFPFPIPLGQESSGRWSFDTAAGKDEILARRIGNNELTAMGATDTIAGAERQYHHQAHDGDKVKQYTPRFISSPGTHDGLYWPAEGAQTPSPLGSLKDFTRVLSSATERDKPPLFNGYSYRILTKCTTDDGTHDYVVKGKMTGGFAVLAYPVEYRNSGIMSFVMGEDGTLYEKDLGEKTAEVAGAMTDVNLTDGWKSSLIGADTVSRTGSE